MTAFTYQGYDGTGQRTNGEMTAGSIEEVERRLANQRVTPTSIVATKGRKAESPKSAAPVPVAPTKARPGRRRKITDADRADLLRDMATMVNAGVPFVETLDAILDSLAKPTLADALEGVRTSIIGGRSISASIRGASNLFPPLVSDVIQVAEKGGRLDDALDNAASYLERSADLRRKITNAMMYPTVMLGISTIMTAVIVVFVIPQFGELFSKMKADLPITTKAMLAVGKFVHVQPLISLGVVFAAAGVITFMFRSDAVRRIVGVVALRVPGLGPLMVRLSLARALRVMSTLLASNVSIMVALEHGGRVAGVPSITAALDNAMEAVRVGGNLSDALRRSPSIPATVTQMIVVGERTGRLTALLQASAEKMETESDARLKSLVAIIEPLMILVMGVLVGGITISIITPIYSVVGNTR